jgi:hypothetical protein
MQSVNLYIVTLYRSPLGSFEIFMQTIVKLFTMIDCKNKNIIIGGDFNLQFDSHNVNTQTLCDLLLSYELRPLVYFVTRKNSCLDNVFTNVLSSLIVSPLCTHFSDHCNKADTKLKAIRSLTEQGRFNFFNLLSNVEWNFIESDTNANNTFHMFLNIIIYYLNLVFPIKTIRVNHNSKNLYIGWFNKELGKMRETLRLLSDNCKLRGTLESKELLASFKKRYNSAIKKAKVDATETFIKNNKSNPRVLWNILGS